MGTYAHAESLMSAIKGQDGPRGSAISKTRQIQLSVCGEPEHEYLGNNSRSKGLFKSHEGRLVCYEYDPFLAKNKPTLNPRLTHPLISSFCYFIFFIHVLLYSLVDYLV